MKETLRKVGEWLLGAAIVIGYTVGGLVAYFIAMVLTGVSFEGAIIGPIVIGLMFGVFLGGLWLAERIHYLWIFLLYALLLVAVGAGVLSLTDSNEVLFFAEGVFVIEGLIVLPMAVSIQRERRKAGVVK